VEASHFPLYGGILVYLTRPTVCTELITVFFQITLFVVFVSFSESEFTLMICGHPSARPSVVCRL